MSESESNEVLIEYCSPNEEVKSLTTLYENGVFSATFRPKSVGKNMIYTMTFYTSKCFGEIPESDINGT